MSILNKAAVMKTYRSKKNKLVWFLTYSSWDPDLELIQIVYSGTGYIPSSGETRCLNR